MNNYRLKPKKKKSNANLSTRLIAYGYYNPSFIYRLSQEYNTSYPEVRDLASSLLRGGYIKSQHDGYINHSTVFVSRDEVIDYKLQSK